MSPSPKGIILKRYQYCEATILKRYHPQKVSSLWCHHPSSHNNIIIVPGCRPATLIVVLGSTHKGFPKASQLLSQDFLLDKRINRISYQTRSKTEFLIRQEAYMSFLFDRKLIRNAHQMRNHQWKLISSAVFELSILTLLLLGPLIVAAWQVCCSSKKLTDSAAGSRSWPPGGACSAKFFACTPIERLGLRARALKILRFL